MQNGNRKKKKKQVYFALEDMNKRYYNSFSNIKDNYVEHLSRCSSSPLRAEWEEMDGDGLFTLK